MKKKLVILLTICTLEFLLLLAAIPKMKAIRRKKV